MSKTVKPSWSFPVIESASADSITLTTVRSLWFVSLLHGIRI